MKQIFDWLREQMQKAEYNHTYFGTDFAVNTERAIEIIDEAEAKWESECCEWKWGIDYAHVQCRGDRILFGSSSRRLFTYCPYCGKPIKISEVE